MNIALPKLALLRALVDEQLSHGGEEQTPVVMLSDVPWMRAVWEERPGTVAVDCGSSSTKFASAVHSKLSKIKTADGSWLKLSAVASVEALAEFVDLILSQIDATHAAHADADVYLFTTEVKNIYAEGRRFSAEFARWVEAVRAERPRLKGFAPLSRDEEAHSEFGTALAMLNDDGKPTKRVAMLTCGGGSFQIAHGDFAKSIEIPQAQLCQLTAIKDNNRLVVNLR